jgi:hypothetical protein
MGNVKFGFELFSELWEVMVAHITYVSHERLWLTKITSPDETLQYIQDNLLISQKNKYVFREFHVGTSVIEEVWGEVNKISIREANPVQARA